MAETTTIQIILTLFSLPLHLCWFISCHPVLNCSLLYSEKESRILIKPEIPKVKLLDCILVVSEKFVYKELSSFDASASTSLGNISARFLKDGVSFLKLPVTYIINILVTNSEVPDELKSARVKPLFKKHCRSEVRSYKPIRT